MSIEIGQIRQWENSVENRTFKVIRNDKTPYGKNYYLIKYSDGLKQLISEEELLEKSFINN